jgi:hypothetical protein
VRLQNFVPMAIAPDHYSGFVRTAPSGFVRTTTWFRRTESTDAARVNLLCQHTPGMESKAGRAALWSAPAERSDDGAFGRRKSPVFIGTPRAVSSLRFSTAVHMADRKPIPSR